MRECPECKRVYADETLNYCLEDGAWLVEEGGSGTDSPTAVLPASESQTGRKLFTDEIRRPGTWSPSNWKWAAGIAAAVLIISGFLLYRGFDTASTGKPIDSIAVLPFANESGNADVEYLSDGITDTLINNLSKIPNLNVKARSTVFRYKGQTVEPATVGKDLSVRAVLNGRVAQRGDDLSLFLSLVDTKTGDQIWGESYERKLSDLVNLQKEIARDVSQKLQLRLTGADVQRATKNYTENAEAYQLYLKGRHHLVKSTAAEVETSIKYFQQAIDLDPSYALAYVGLADAYRAPVSERVPSEALSKSKAAVQKAIEIDSNLADAHAVLGFIIFWYEWDWAAAEAEYKRAISIDPENADAHLFYAHLLSNTGRHQEALSEAKRARELDPLNPRTTALEGQFLIHAGRVDEGMERLRATLELAPDHWMAHLFAASGYIEKGMYPEAIEEGRKTIEVEPQSRSFSFLGYALAKSGRQQEARDELARLLELSRSKWISPYSIATIYNGLDDREQTYAWLDRGLKDRDPKMVFLKVEPKWNNLRGDLRFQNIIHAVGF